FGIQGETPNAIFPTPFPPFEGFASSASTSKTPPNVVWSGATVAGEGRRCIDQVGIPSSLVDLPSPPYIFAATARQHGQHPSSFCEAPSIFLLHRRPWEESLTRALWEEETSSRHRGRLIYSVIPLWLFNDQFPPLVEDDLLCFHRKWLSVPSCDIEQGRHCPPWFSSAEFIENEGAGEPPLEGSIPDMTSLTEYYVSLQK
ncbi:hypothetical protein Taro_052791, partial [Colocasia esculenta]|nr:hypothetical protein [Colocasia esculenta]